MDAVNIQSFQKIAPMIYAYTTPDISYHDGWIKIGYTEKQTVEERIKEQCHTADVRWHLEWKNNAIYTDGSYDNFTDHDFHNYLTKEKRVERQPNTEWFHLGVPQSKEYFYSFASREVPVQETGSTYTLREEQERAVHNTKEYFESGGTEFLWNAKPRFGKTLTAYDLIRRMGLTKVLIVTNRPSIANSWYEDFYKFIGWQEDLYFVSENDAVKDKPGVMSWDEYRNVVLNSDDEHGFIEFESLQGLKGSRFFGGSHDNDKFYWIVKEWFNEKTNNKHGEQGWKKGLDFDLVIIDEAHEATETKRAYDVFDNINAKYILQLSGTPFKKLASGKYKEEQIFNWSYVDEQEKKDSWDKEEFNPYEQLPRMAMYTYQLSNMVLDKVQRGCDLSDDEAVDYAFDLAEFFATDDKGNFIHKEEIKKFLHALTTQEKYPFSTPQLRKELSHTLWILNRVPSCKALEKLLKEDDVFSEYKVVVAAGDNKTEEDEAPQEAYDKVKDAIDRNNKTITLSVGKLTVGVTIPEWSGVLMLCNLSSPSSYMQAAFRAQNPYITPPKSDGKLYRKKRPMFLTLTPLVHLSFLMSLPIIYCLKL